MVKTVNLDSRLGNINACIQCGMCTAICPSSQVNDYNPRIAINFARHGDAYLKGNREKEFLKKVDSSDCFQCYSCSTVCPRGLSVGEAMKYLREVLEEGGFDRRLGLLRENLLEYGQSIVPEIFDNADKVWGDSWTELRKKRSYGKDMPKKREIPQRVVKEVDYLVKSARNLKLESPKRENGGEPKDFDGLILFESCCGASHYPGIGRSSRYILRKMGFHPKILDDQSCCGGFAYYANDLNLNEVVLVGARNQGLIENNGETVVSECNSCFSSNLAIKELLTNGENRRQINDVLSTVNKRVNGGLNVTHIEEVIHHSMDLLKDQIEVDLGGLNVATHSGCHYRNFSARPERNRLLDEVVKATGVNVIDYPLKNRCCGGGFEKSFVGNIGEVRKLNFKKQKSITDVGADLLIVDCPGCQMTFDRNNPELNKAYRARALECMHISQFLALAMGADVYEIVGIQHHSVPPTSVLEKIGITDGLQASLFTTSRGIERAHKLKEAYKTVKAWIMHKRIHDEQ